MKLSCKIYILNACCATTYLRYFIIHSICRFVHFHLFIYTSILALFRVYTFIITCYIVLLTQKRLFRQVCKIKFLPLCWQIFYRYIIQGRNGCFLMNLYSVYTTEKRQGDLKCMCGPRESRVTHVLC